jgi:hypothetical protein
VHGIFGQQPTGETLITLVLPIIDHILTIEKQPDERFVIYQSSVQAFNLPNYLFNECHEAHLHYPQFRADCTRNPYGDGKVLSRREMSNWLADLKLLLRSLHRNQNVQASRWLFERLFWSEPRNYLSNFISTFRHQPLVFTVHESDGVSCPLAFKRLKSI